MRLGHAYLRSELMSALGKMATDWNVRIREMAVQLLLEVRPMVKFHV